MHEELIINPNKRLEDIYTLILNCLVEFGADKNT